MMYDIACSACYSFPQVAQWEGDGLDKDIGIDAAGEILTKYAEACVIEVLYGCKVEKTRGNHPKRLLAACERPFAGGI